MSEIQLVHSDIDKLLLWREKCGRKVNGKRERENRETHVERTAKSSFSLAITVHSLYFIFFFFLLVSSIDSFFLLIYSLFVLQFRVLLDLFFLFLPYYLNNYFFPSSFKTNNILTLSSVFYIPRIIKN